MNIEIKLQIDTPDRIRTQYVSVSQEDIDKMSPEVLWKYFMLACERIRHDATGYDSLDEIQLMNG